MTEKIERNANKRIGLYHAVARSVLAVLLNVRFWHETEVHQRASNEPSELTD
ncbi:hypothetical protein [Pseudidiomarina gelatinasegens]|uniref:hypothetical protein n=1 Tax=Pseudidiomarina gelatinasegens TaxID=2487740 RepID=UPI003A96D30C